MKTGLAVGLGLAALAGVGAVAYAASNSRHVRLNHGGVYTWVDTRGFDAAQTKANYEQLGFASVSIVQVEGGWGIQAVWNGKTTDLDTPQGMTPPEFHGYIDGRTP